MPAVGPRSSESLFHERTRRASFPNQGNSPTREGLGEQRHVGLREVAGQRLGQREEVVIIVNKLRLIVVALLDWPGNSH